MAKRGKKKKSKKKVAGGKKAWAKKTKAQKEKQLKSLEKARKAKATKKEAKPKVVTKGKYTKSVVVFHYRGHTFTRSMKKGEREGMQAQLDAAVAAKKVKQAQHIAMKKLS